MLEFVIVASVAKTFDYFGKESVFEFVHARRESFGRVVAFHLAFCLKERNSLVEVCIAYVYRDSRFGFPAFQYVFMNVQSVHAFSAM